MYPSLASRLVALATVVTCLTPRSPAQTTLYSISSPGPWDMRSLGDVDGDGVADFALGCPEAIGFSCNPSGGGVVHVYSGRTGVELYQVGAPPGAMTLDAFGFSIDAVGDTNGDGVPDFVVGAPLWSSVTSSCGEGRAYICSGQDGTILQTLVGPGNVPGAYQLFGDTVAGIGDANGDGIPDVAVGSEYGYNNLGVQSGYVCIYSGLDGSIIHTLYGNWNGERFGTCCAAAGDLNGDGYSDVLVGSPYATYSGGVGGVRVYSGFDGLLLTFITGTATINIGYGVASTGDINGDGVPDFITGATPSYGNLGGRVYSGMTGTLLYTVPANPTVAVYPAGIIPYSHPVGSCGDVDGDGIPDIITATSGGAVISSGSTGALLASHAMPTFVSSVGTATDLNGDGRADFMCTSWNGGTTFAAVVLSDCPVPTNYCTGKLNSVGCTPAMTSTGVLSLSVGNDDFFAFGTSEMNNVSGMLLWSTHQNSVPFHGGTLCLGASIQRTPIQNSGGSASGIDCTGSYSYHFTRAYVSGLAVPPGTRIYSQYWSRDPGYSPPNNIGLTDGLSFTVCP